MPPASFDLIVIGEGVAGLACAGRAAALGLRCATFECAVFGGLILNVNELDPPPADRPHGGADFAAAMVEDNAGLGVASHAATVCEVRRTSSGFDVVAEDATYGATSVVIASGAARAVLGVPGEAELTGLGVSQCADCDGPLYRGQDVVVVGGGDSALQEALVLARFCRTVHLVHRRNSFRAHSRFVQRIGNAPPIRPILDSEVTRILGDDGVVGVTLRDRHSGAERDLPCAAVFAYVGLRPNADYLPPDVARDGDGYVTTGPDRATSMPGLYAIGAVRAGHDGTIAGALVDAESAAAAIAARLSAQGSAVS